MSTVRGGGITAATLKICAKDILGGAAFDSEILQGTAQLVGRQDLSSGVSREALMSKGPKCPVCAKPMDTEVTTEDFFFADPQKRLSFEPLLANG